MTFLGPAAVVRNGGAPSREQSHRALHGFHLNEVDIEEVESQGHVEQNVRVFVDVFYSENHCQHVLIMFSEIPRRRN